MQQRHWLRYIAWTYHTWTHAKTFDDTHLDIWVSTSLLLQVTDSDMSAAQSRIQSLFQTFVFQPISQEQVLQIVVFVVMFAGALGFFIWNIKPFLAQFSQASCHHKLHAIGQHNKLNYFECIVCLVWMSMYFELGLYVVLFYRMAKTIIQLASVCSSGTQTNSPAAESATSRHWHSHAPSTRKCHRSCQHQERQEGHCSSRFISKCLQVCAGRLRHAACAANSGVFACLMNTKRFDDRRNAWQLCSIIMNTALYARMCNASVRLKPWILPALLSDLHLLRSMFRGLCRCGKRMVRYWCIMRPAISRNVLDSEMATQPVQLVVVKIATD